MGRTQSKGDDHANQRKESNHMKVKDMENYNGPDREQFLDTLADYEERRFNIAREMSFAGKILEKWEKEGGHRDDIRDGYKLRKMDADDQQAELRRQFRVAGWLGITDEDVAGQRSFLKVFEVKSTPVNYGIGGAPLGSRLSIVRAKARGYEDGKTKNGPSLQEGLEQFDWEPDSDESLSYSEMFGQGLPLRPPPKSRKSDVDSGSFGGVTIDGDGEADAPPVSALGVMVDQLKAMDEAEAAKPKRGRPRKQVALPAPDTEDEPPAQAAESVEDIWDNAPRIVN
jgi:hypothetical protein